MLALGLEVTTALKEALMARVSSNSHNIPHVEPTLGLQEWQHMVEKYVQKGQSDQQEQQRLQRQTQAQKKLAEIAKVRF